MLRPETVESIFIAYRLTGAQKYRDYAWKIFEAIEKHCKLPDAGSGYATIVDVDGNNGGRSLLDDKQETFFLVNV
jgi:endoplasmic reticulum Man9GlcNAc2 1,2-alpha-mannosidase